MTPRGRAAWLPTEEGLAQLAEAGLGDPSAVRQAERDYDRAEAGAVARMRARGDDPYAEALGVGVLQHGVTDLVSSRRGPLGRFTDGEGGAARWQRWSPHLDVALEVVREPLSGGEREAREAWCAARGVLWLWPADGRVLDPAAVRVRALEWQERRREGECDGG